MECVFIIKYGNNVHNVICIELDVLNETQLESKVCRYYILCLIRVHIVVNENLTSNYECYSNTSDKFFGGNKYRLTLTTLETCIYKSITICESGDSFKGELVQKVHHDVGGSTTLLAWCLSESSVTQVVAPCPFSFTDLRSGSLEQTLVLNLVLYWVERLGLNLEGRPEMNSRGVLISSGEAVITPKEEVILERPGFLFRLLRNLSSILTRATFGGEATGERTGPATLLGKNCRRTRLGSPCKLTLLFNGSPLIQMYVNLEAQRKDVKTYPGMMASAMWTPTLLRHELLGSHLREVNIMHRSIGAEEAKDWRGGCFIIINSLVSSEGAVEKEGIGFSLGEFSLSIECQVRTFHHNIVCCVYRIDAIDSCTGHGRVPLTAKHSDACGWNLPQNGSVTLTTTGSEAADAAQDNKRSADKITRQKLCEIKDHCAISGLNDNEDVCDYFYCYNYDYQRFIHENDICCEIIDIVMY